MPSVLLHGAALSWSCDGLAEDPIADVLAMVEPSACDPRLAQPVHIDLRPATKHAAGDPRDEGFIPSFFHGAVQAYRGSSGFLLWDRSSRVLVPMNGAPASGEVVPPGQERHAGSTTVLLQIALTLLLRGVQLFHLHAAAVVRPDNGVLIIAGGSGAGKTTTTLALLEAGCGYLGDDALFLRAGEAGTASVAHAIAFPRAFHLGPATLSAFPRLRPLAGPALLRSDKRPVDPRLAFPGRHHPEIPLASGQTLAVFPTIGDGPTTEIGSITKADAFGHLLASSATLIIEGIPHRDLQIALLRALLNAASCLELRLGKDALDAPIAAISARLLSSGA